MGTARSLMSQHHILEDLNLQCFYSLCKFVYFHLFFFFLVEIPLVCFYTPSSHLWILKLNCRIYFGVGGFEVPTAVSLRIWVFWHLMRCCWVNVTWCFNRTLPFAWTHQTLKLQALNYFEMPGKTNPVLYCSHPRQPEPSMSELFTDVIWIFDILKRDVKMPCKRISLFLGAPLGNLEGFHLPGLFVKKG